VLVGAEGLVPEVARAICLDGAELVLWAADAGTPLALEVARARAIENRVWVGLLSPAPGQGVDGESIAAVLDPDGRVVAIGLRGSDHLVTAVVSLASARQKQMAPGTNVLTDRQPESYAVLLRADGGEER
jgi:predicted amidohydrolase